MGIDDHLHSSSQLVRFGLSRPSVVIQVDSITQPGVFNPCVPWVYVIVRRRACSAVHGLSRLPQCSIIDLLFRGDRQVPDSPSQYSLQYLISVKYPREFSNILPQVRISFLSSSKCYAVPYFHTPSSLAKAKQSKAEQSRNDECMA